MSKSQQRIKKKQKLTIQTFEWSYIEHKIFLKKIKEKLKYKKKKLFE